MWFGSKTDVAVQQRIHAGRQWIDAQPNLLAHGRAVCVFEAHARKIDELVELLERFNRVYFYLDPKVVKTFMDQIGARGYNTIFALALKGGDDHLKRCAELAVPVEQKLPGAKVTVVDDDASDELVSAIQEFYGAVDLTPQPAPFIRGYDGTVVTTVTVGTDGQIIGTSSIHHFRKAGPRLAHVAYSCNTGILPKFRASGLARWQNATAVIEARRRFGFSEVWGNTLPTNGAAIAFHRSLNRAINPAVGYFWAERAV